MCTLVYKLVDRLRVCNFRVFNFRVCNFRVCYFSLSTRVCRCARVVSFLVNFIFAYWYCLQISLRVQALSSCLKTGLLQNTI